MIGSVFTDRLVLIRNWLIQGRKTAALCLHIIHSPQCQCPHPHHWYPSSQPNLYILLFCLTVTESWWTFLESEDTLIGKGTLRWGSWNAAVFLCSLGLPACPRVFLCKLTKGPVGCDTPTLTDVCLWDHLDEGRVGVRHLG